MGVGAKEGNTNAEKWTIEIAEEVFKKAIELARFKTDYVIGSGQNASIVEGFKYHYIGEIATSEEIDQYADIFKYLKEAHKSLKPYYDRLKSILESNCFSDSKKGIIKEATAIMNLKSNYKWTDRSDITTKDKEIQQTPVIRFIKTDE